MAHSLRKAFPTRLVWGRGGGEAAADLVHPTQSSLAAGAQGWTQCLLPGAQGSAGLQQWEGFYNACLPCQNLQKKFWEEPSVKV